ncbi:hypothetical protein R1flu_008714 [Riccia fluitans]|uniref:GPI inositol-deacylase n=1 Tax=Riccia fluitans TaxID=41844 RepID=A0ABD1YG12_9MARC
MGFSSRTFGFGVAVSILVAGWIVGSGLIWLLTPMPNGCAMTFMYPTYIPITPPLNMTSSRYALYLYHEGWKKIDYELHLLKLSGVPVLFIPGNGGSYKQVRSLAAESDRAYYGGPSEEGFFQQAGLTSREAGSDSFGDLGKDVLYTAQEQYANKLDWFTVDLEGEHSAMDGRILEEHTEYVVLAINRILDRYKESLKARSFQTKEIGDFLPTSVILVGHSMGGFVARAALVHPQLRNGAVETIVTLSSPHLLAPVPLQPSLGHLFNRVNDAWRKGYESPRKRMGRFRRKSQPLLGRVVVISIFGGTHDYQVRSRFASLKGIVPPTNALMIGAPGILNVWFSTEHQSILWCNQLAVQLSHTLLQLVDKKTGQPFDNPQMRLAVFVAKLRSALPQVFGWLPSYPFQGTNALALLDHSEDTKLIGEQRNLDTEDAGRTRKDGESTASGGTEAAAYSCPKSTRWTLRTKEKDLEVETPSVTVLAMDGRRRWMDIQAMRASGKIYFTMVTNLPPCTGVRVHLWPEKAKSAEEKAISQILLEVTMKMAQLPAGPYQTQTEPGGQTEQPPPSGILHLNAADLQGFRYLTISVAPRPTVSGRPPAAASMAVGQFYNPKEGKMVLSPWWLLTSTYRQQGLVLKESHPIVTDFSMAFSLGSLPISLEIRTRSCGSTDSVLADSKPTESELMSLCKLRCFPPVILVWDSPSGLEIFPNHYHETISVDSSPAIWGSEYSSEKSALLLLVDPHCEYRVSMRVSLYAAASRFLLMHSLQVVAVTVAVLFFAMMRQARAWELDAPVPSVLSCVEAHMILPFPFMTFALGPLAVYAVLTVFGTHVVPPLLSFVAVSTVCYIFANGTIAVLAICTVIVFYIAASLQVFLKVRWQRWEDRWHTRGLQWLFRCMSRCSTWQVFRAVRAKPSFTFPVVTTVLIFFVHPALGLIVLLLAHTWSCHGALCSYSQQGNISRQPKRVNSPGKVMDVWRSQVDASTNPEPGALTFGETQIEIFHLRHGLLLLHLLATMMFMPSFVAWMQRAGKDRTLPSFIDSSLCFGLLLHGLYASNADTSINLLSKVRLPGLPLNYPGLGLIYAVAGIYCYIAGLALAPYRAFHCMAAIGYFMTFYRLREKSVRDKVELGVRRRHFHRH